jgi:hypothetical protein
MSKSEKSGYFRHVFANNIFGAFLKNFFNSYESSVKFCLFDTHFAFMNLKNLFALIRTFSKLCIQMRTKRHGKPFFIIVSWSLIRQPSMG